MFVCNFFRLSIVFWNVFGSYVVYVDSSVRWTFSSPSPTHTLQQSLSKFHWAELLQLYGAIFLSNKLVALKRVNELSFVRLQGDVSAGD